MSNEMTPETRLVSLILEASERSVLRRVVFSKPNDPMVIRMVLTPMKMGGREVFQAEFFHRDNKATHVNHEISRCESALAE